MLASLGVPGVYFHSLFGSRGWRAGVDLSGRNRSINRQKFDFALFERELLDEASLHCQVFRRYAQLLHARSSSAAFDPHGKQEVLDGGKAVFTLFRLSPDGAQRVLCLHNVSDQTQRVRIETKEIFGLFAAPLTDLITGQRMDDLLNDIVTLRPYQTLWLRMMK